MPVLPVIFEDETLVGFRPLSWTVPVGELRCGLLSPRERLATLCGRPPVLLVRDLLAELAADGGHPVGPDAVRGDLAPETRLLLVSGRVGANWDLLGRVTGAAVAGVDGGWRDDDGWLAISAAGEAAQALVTSWERWQSETAAAGCWRRAEVAAPSWRPEVSGEVHAAVGAWRRIWHLVPDTAAAMQGDLERLGGRLPERQVWGAIPDAADHAEWARGCDLVDLWTEGTGLATPVGEHPILAGPDCELQPGVCLDASEGPIVLGRGVRVLAGSYLAGPLFVGSGSLIKAGAAIYGETSLGAVCKVGGEVGETTLLDFVNKQHEGFLGHAYVGSWCNLGALTTCSDLKNAYGEIRVDLGSGPEPSGQRFVGVLMGEHSKTAIGTLLNSGTTVGFASNVFGEGFPAKALPCFTWGDGRQDARQDPRRALEVAEVVMQRRRCRLTGGHRRVFDALGT